MNSLFKDSMFFCAFCFAAVKDLLLLTVAYTLSPKKTNIGLIRLTITLSLSLRSLFPSFKHTHSQFEWRSVVMFVSMFALHRAFALGCWLSLRFLHPLLATHMVVLDEPSALQSLRGSVSNVTRKEQQVSRLHLPGEAHKNHRVQTESASHRAGNNLRIFLQITERRNRDAPVRDRTPEVSAHQILPELFAFQVV